MLCRFAKVSPEGTYQPPPPANQKASYATLVYVRATIVEEAGWYLAKSLTIAVSIIWLPSVGQDLHEIGQQAGAASSAQAGGLHTQQAAHACCADLCEMPMSCFIAGWEHCRGLGPADAVCQVSP